MFVRLVPWPRLPGDRDPGARQEPRTKVRKTGPCRRYPSRRPANLSRFAGEDKSSLSAAAKVTNLT